jgi:hypothetical protein
MKGYDPDFADLPDYIVKITERIWEGRGVHLIRRWYAPDCLIHTPLGEFQGDDFMIEGTLATLMEFPDRRVVPDDIIWSGNEDSGFLSSHRALSLQTHTGGGAYGPASGRRMAVRAIADCACHQNRIHEEWLVRDTAAIARGCGLDPVDWAHQLAQQDELNGKPLFGTAQAKAALAGEAAAVTFHQDHWAARRVTQAMEAVWNRAELNVVPELYHPGCHVSVPGGHTLIGHAAVDAWLLGWLASFPTRRLVVDHAIALEEPGFPVRVATRWRLGGVHGGNGPFGAPSHVPVYVLGMTHTELFGGRIVRQFWVADELAMHRQIARGRG